MNKIVIRGAREHNLQGINLEIPRDSFVVITGPSGSGKSSLAFDTIYAEGQRRYVEALSTHARQFLERMKKPDVDSIEGLSPAISIQQHRLSRNPRSTVATITELHDFLRLLFARIGRVYCHRCSRELQAWSVAEIAKEVLKLPLGTRLSIIAPLNVTTEERYKQVLSDLQREGFTRISVNGELYDLGDDALLEHTGIQAIDVYVDRIVLKESNHTRVAESVELASQTSGGIVKVAVIDDRGTSGEDVLFTEQFVCPNCLIRYPELTPRLFSFNSPDGACPSCDGIGTILEFDEQRIVPNDRLSLREGAVVPWSKRNAKHHDQVLEQLAKLCGFSLVVPYRDLPEGVRRLLMDGSGADEFEFTIDEAKQRRTYKRSFEGVKRQLQKRWQERQKRRADDADYSDDEDDTSGIRQFMSSRPCQACEGSRLRIEARHVKVGGFGIDEFLKLDVQAASLAIAELALSSSEKNIVGTIIGQINARLSFLCAVGLHYVTLDRQSSTLSGGEGQRVRIATQIGAALVGVLYILDEPSVGLHPKDHDRLLRNLLELRRHGSSVLVVEHDLDTIRHADYVVDLGPGAGINGGRVVATGTVEQICRNKKSLTGQFLSGRRSINKPNRQCPKRRRHLHLRGVRHRNLKNVDISVPLGLFVAVSGVSGSGKSSLIMETLLPALRNATQGGHDTCGQYRGLSGTQFVDRVIAIDQTPIGRSPRSNPATYTGVFTLVRELFASLPEARMRGYQASRFSFNVKGGRCEVCRGEGALRIEMAFLPDVFVPCEVCNGSRYNDAALQVRFKGCSIADVLQMSVSDARGLFANVPKLREKLDALVRVGLGYLALGQAGNTLSGGEAQRVKLSRELGRRSHGKSVYILDEPTSGLHLADIGILLQLLDKLVENGNTVIVIEHQLDVLKYADYVIDLGPEGGPGGGSVVATGTPHEIAANARSATGSYLKRVLN